MREGGKAVMDSNDGTRTERHPRQDATYVLGHANYELARLELQGALYNPSTRRLLREAGIDLGMRVLDAGSGAGDVSLLAAELVGPSGVVVGVERDSAAIRYAAERAQRSGHGNVNFVQGDLRDPPLD